MRWCRSCVLPDSRPNLTINSDGVCSACETFRGRAEIDWQQRERAFETIVDNASDSGLRGILVRIGLRENAQRDVGKEQDLISG